VTGSEAFATVTLQDDLLLFVVDLPFECDGQAVLLSSLGRARRQSLFIGAPQQSRPSRNGVCIIAASIVCTALPPASMILSACAISHRRHRHGRQCLGYSRTQKGSRRSYLTGGLRSGNSRGLLRTITDQQLVCSRVNPMRRATRATRSSNNTCNDWIAKAASCSVQLTPL